MDKRVKLANKLIVDIGKGKLRSLDKLYVEFGGLFFVMAKKYLYNKNDAEDLISEVLLKLVKGSKNFDSESNGLNYIIKIIKNSAITANSKNANVKAVSLENIEEIPTSDDFYTNLIIDEGLKKLNTTQKQIIYLKFYEGYTVREIAGIMKMSASSVQREVKASLKILKDSID